MRKLSELNAERDRIDLDKYRLLQAAALLELFRQTHGREAMTPEEVGRWALTADFPRNARGTVDPFRVLTPAQIRDLER